MLSASRRVKGLRLKYSLSEATPLFAASPHFQQGRTQQRIIRRRMRNMNDINHLRIEQQAVNIRQYLPLISLSSVPSTPFILSNTSIQSIQRTIRGKSTAEIELNVYFYVDMSFQCLIPVITIVFIPGFGYKLQSQDSPDYHQTMSKVLLMRSVNNWRKPFTPNIVISISSFLSLALC